MNAKSYNDKCHDDFKCCNQAHCCPGHPLATKSILACGQGSGFAIPISIANPIPVASATIDTTCLCDPKIKIDFNSLINYQVLIDVLGTLATPFTVTFQLSKTCCDGSKISLGSWDYSYGSVALATNITNSFGFSYCECNPCPGCCVYTVDIVRVSGASVLPIPPLDSITLTENASIRSSILTIIASSN